MTLLSPKSVHSTATPKLISHSHELFLQQKWRFQAHEYFEPGDDWKAD